jgi:hypothetical protein
MKDKARKSKVLFEVQNQQSRLSLRENRPVTNLQVIPLLFIHRYQVFFTSGWEKALIEQNFQGPFSSDILAQIPPTLGIMSPSTGLGLDEEEIANNLDYQFFETLYANPINHWRAMCQV